MSSSSLVVLLSCLLLSSHLCPSVAQATPPLVKGLSWTFYKSNCPNLEKIIRDHLKTVFKKDIGQAAGLLRLQFHDCFVQGCDGSVLLDGSASGPSEKDAPPNLTLRPEAFRIINDLRQRIHKQCGQVVSCSDMIALAARDSVFLAGGPDYKVPLGRRDGLTFATQEATLNNLLPFTAKVEELLGLIAPKNLDATDLVALSGGHTIGLAHCASFTERLYPNQDPIMDKSFANQLKGVCPTATTDSTTFQDIRTPNVFDNKYYVDLMNRQGLFTSDQDLYTDSRTKPIVTNFAKNETLFFEKFVFSMIKMGQMSVVTGTQGEIRANCAARNPAKKHLSSVVDEATPMSQLAFLCLPLIFLTLLAPPLTVASDADEASVEKLSAYDVLKAYNFPAGLLPVGVTGYELDPETGEFKAYLDGSCSFSIQGYQLKYKSTITGVISKGKLSKLKGVSVKVLLFWINISEVTISGDQLYFSVGIISKSFPVDNFDECPQCGCGFDCVNGKGQGQVSGIKGNPFVSSS